MEKRVLSYHDFSGKKFERTSDQSGQLNNLESFNAEGSEANNESHEQQKNYMFFQNLATIKHYIGEIMAMDKTAIDNILSGGHDWASDHLATAKDDVEEVTNFLRNEIEMGATQEENKWANIEKAIDAAGGNIQMPVELFNDEVEGEEEGEEEDNFEVEIEDGEETGGEEAEEESEVEEETEDEEGNEDETEEEEIEYEEGDEE